MDCGKLGFLKDEEPVFAAPSPNYKLGLPGAHCACVATVIAGALETAIVFGAGFGLARAFSHDNSGAIAQSGEPSTAETEWTLVTS